MPGCDDGKMRLAHIGDSDRTAGRNRPARQPPRPTLPSPRRLASQNVCRPPQVAALIPRLEDRHHCTCRGGGKGGEASRRSPQYRNRDHCPGRHVDVLASKPQVHQHCASCRAVVDGQRSASSPERLIAEILLKSLRVLRAMTLPWLFVVGAPWGCCQGSTSHPESLSRSTTTDSMEPG